MNKLKLLAYTVAGFLTHCAVGQNVDATVQAQNLVSLNGEVPYTHTVSTTETIIGCSNPHPTEASPVNMCLPFTFKQNGSQVDQVIPTVSNVRIISTTPVMLEPLVRTELPSDPTVASQEFVNCGGVNTQQSMNLSVNFQRSTSVALSHSVTNSKSLTVSVGFKAGVFSAGASATIGQSTTDGSVDTTGIQMAVQRTSALAVTLAKGQGVVGQLEVWPVTYSQVFHTNVTIDADLSANDKYSHLSDMFPDPIKRTFPVSGTVVATDGSDGKTLSYDDPITPDITPVTSASGTSRRKAK